MHSYVTGPRKTILMEQTNNVPYATKLLLCRLQAEVEEVLEGRTEVTNEDLEKLQYTEQVNYNYNIH